jgi:hypothetical protein
MKITISGWSISLRVTTSVPVGLDGPPWQGL